MKNKNKQATVAVIATTLSITPIISPLKVYAKDETADSSEVSNNPQEPTYTGDPYKIPIGNEEDSEILEFIDSTPVNDQITDRITAEAEVKKALDAYEFTNGTTEAEVEAYLKTMLVDSGKLIKIHIDSYKITPAKIDQAGHVEIRVYVRIVGQSNFDVMPYEADFPRLLNPGEMYINKDNFPDDEFRRYVEDLEKRVDIGNGDSILSESEIEKITCINVYNMTTITSLKGIEYFPKLQFLYCSGTSIKELDVSDNKNLEILYCSDNSELVKLNVKGADALSELLCSNTSITEIDVSENKSLIWLNCSNNLQLVTLNVKGADALQTLFCLDISIKEIDVSENKSLTTLDCYNNPELVALNIKGADALQELYCANTSIEELDASENKNLTDLICFSNPELVALNIKGADALQILDVYKTGIKELDASENKNLTRLFCEGSSELENLKVTGADALQGLNCSETSIKELDVSKNKNLTHINCSQNPGLTNLSLKGADVLKELNCSETGIKELDISENKHLTVLECNNTSLAWFHIGDNKTLIVFKLSDSVIDLDITSPTFNIKEVFKGIDITKVKMISGGTLEYESGIVSGYKAGIPIVYTYDCGKVNNESVFLNVTLNLPKSYSTIEITSDSMVEYTGKPYQPTVKKTGSNGEVTYTYEIRSGESWIPYNQVPINVGEYRVQAHLAGDDYYEETVSEETAFEIVQANNAWTLNPAIENWEFKDTPNTPTASAKFGDITYAYSNEKDGAYTSTIPTQVGTYYLKATVAGTKNYTGLEKVISFEIIPKNVENSDRITISEIKKEEDVKNLVIKDGDQVLEEGIDYNVESKQEGNLFTVIITFEGNYTGTIKKTYKVNAEEPDKEVDDQPKEEPKIDEPKQKLKEESKTDIIKDTGNVTSTGFLGAWGMILAGGAYVFTGKKKDQKHVD